MDVRNTSGAVDSVLLQILQSRQSQENSAASSTQIAILKKQPLPPREQDIIRLSNNKTEEGHKNAQNLLEQKRTRLTSEETDQLENGFRRIQTFESADGRQFTRIEEFTTSTDRSKRIVLQQNDSGSTSILENIIDRQEDGTFRSTQRFTDSTGETKTNIEFNVTPTNRDIILGRAPDPTQSNDKSFQLTRGTQLDISA